MPVIYHAAKIMLQCTIKARLRALLRGKAQHGRSMTRAIIAAKCAVITCRATHQRSVTQCFIAALERNGIRLNRLLRDMRRNHPCC
jgi:hypothetical protein